MMIDTKENKTAELYNKIVALNNEIQKDLATLKTQQDDETES